MDFDAVPRRWPTMHDLYNLSPALRKELYPYLQECATLAPAELEPELTLLVNRVRSSLQHDGVFVD